MAIASDFRLGILLTGHLTAEMEQHFGSLEQSFFDFFTTASQGRFQFTCYDACNGQLPAHPDECDGYVVTGSEDSVLDRAAWMAALQAWLRSAAQSKRIVGICFGHQLLADAFGGQVARAANWGLGQQTYRLHLAQAWMQPALPEIVVPACHEDQVVEPPPGAQLLAGNDFCPIGMLRIGTHVLTLQSHPEMCLGFADFLIQERRAQLGAPMAQAACDSLQQPSSVDMVGRWMVNFLRSA